MPEAHQGAAMAHRCVGDLLRSLRDDCANRLAAHARFRSAWPRSSLGRHTQGPHGIASSVDVSQSRRGVVDTFVKYGMTVRELTTLLDYHYWARDRLLEALDALTLEQFTRDMGNSFRSIRDTAAHIYAAEWAW